MNFPEQLIILVILPPEGSCMFLLKKIQPLEFFKVQMSPKTNSRRLSFIKQPGLHTSKFICHWKSQLPV